MRAIVDPWRAGFGPPSDTLVLTLPRGPKRLRSEPWARLKMSLFIFSHDEGVPIRIDRIRELIRARSDVASIHESKDAFAALTWNVERDEAGFECTLAIDGSAIWADYDVEAACQHLVELAAACPFPMDLCDEEYAAHIHLHDRTGNETPWAELERLWSESEGGG